MRGRRMRRLVGAVVASAALAAGSGAVVAQPAGAATYDCTTRATAQSFAQYGDQNQYFLVPDGTFENGAPTWLLEGAQAAAERMTLLSHYGRTDDALYLPPGSSATSPTMCVASNEDSLRFFYRGPGWGKPLRVTVTVQSAAGSVTRTLDLDGGLGWQVSPRIMLPDVRDQHGRQYVTLTFAPLGRFTSWYVDDVQIDPWRTV